MNPEAARPLLRRVADAPDRFVVLLLLAISYVPILFTDIGRVSADTKSYLTLDPGAVVRTAPTMWDPSVGAGTVPHQNIGYLFPLGPYYWLMEHLAVPDWITQRLLWGTLVFAAAYGTYRLLRWLGWEVTAALVAALAYGLSPYFLSYLARLSAILGPWAAMPWMILLAAKAARTRSWRPAAWFAIVVLLVGSVNATALVFAGLGPVLWLIADAVAGRVRPRAAIGAALRIGALSALVSVWWIVGLRAQGTYGIPILRYTESYRAVAGASTPAEVLRGLGYWFFYGGDGLDPWVGPSAPYIDNPVLMTLGFVIAGLSLLGFLVPFAGRSVAALLLLVGLAVSVGAAPIGDSTLYGSWFESFADDTTIGLALRSTTRAAPLVVLALAMGLGSAAGGARRWLASRPRRSASLSWLAPTLIAVLLVLQMYPWFTGTVLTPSIQRDEQLPAYETELADWLDASREGRVYEIPGADFANYRWGGTVDPVLPGIIDRPYLSRELVPQGGAATADLLNGFERRLSDGWFEPESLAPVAQLFDVETVVTRNDLEHERYGLARPGPLWTDVTSVLGEPDHAGPSITDETAIPLVDSLALSRPDAATEFPAVAAFDLEPAPVVTTLPVADPLVVVGSGDGLVDLASVGLLPSGRVIAYAATLDDLARSGELTPAQADAFTGTDAWWVITDTNRRQGRHWSTIGSNLGAIESAAPLTTEDDPGDNRLDLFEDRIENQTVAVHRAGVSDVRASDYGNQIAYTPEDAPWFAIDGDPSTAWRAGVFAPIDGLVWEADLAGVAATDEITLLQPITGAVDRFITRVRVTVDGESIDVDLDERSRTEPGQVVALPVDTFATIRIDVLEDNLGDRSSYAALPGVGFAEVVIPGVVDDRVVRVPSVADNAAFDATAPPDRLTYVFTRERISAATPNRTAPEPRLVREFDVPDQRPFTVMGEVRLSASASDNTLQQALQESPSVVADRRLHGSVAARGASAIDGDRSTAWTTPVDDVVGAALTISAPIESNALSITWLDDDQHSVPTSFVLRGDGGEPRTLETATATAISRAAGLATATFDLGGYSAPSSVLTVETIEPRTVPEYFSRLPQVLPVAIAEIELDGGPIVDGPPSVDTGCRADLLTLDGEPLEVRIVGDRDLALSGGELQLDSCGGPIDLDLGTHRIDAASGSATGFDVDRLVLDADGAGAVPVDDLPPPQVDRRSATSLDVDLPASASPIWLTLNESWNPGWTATIDGADLGEPVLVGGYKNGWLVPADAAARVVELRWTPQRGVRLGFAVSAFGALLVLVILIITWPRRGSSRPLAVGPGADRAPTPLWSRRSLVAGAALALVLLLVGGVAAAVAVAITLLVTTHWRWWPAVAVLGLGAIVGGAIVALEWRRDYAAGPDWPSQFGWTAPLVWVLIAVVVTTAVFPSGAGPRWERRTGTRDADVVEAGR